MHIKQIPTPQELIPKLKNKLPKYIVTTFIWAFCLCLLIHRQVYSNVPLNHDSMATLFRLDYGVASGRWLLPYAVKIHGNWSIPWIIGILASLYLALATCIVVYIMRVRSTIGCMATAALIASFPAVTATNLYLFSADAYLLSFLLSAIGAYLVINCRFGVFTGAVFIALSSGIYQTYVSVTAGLLVAALIFDLIDGETELGPLFVRALKYLASLALGIAIYYIIVKITSRNTGLVDYKGISSMGKFTLNGLIQGFIYSYVNYINFFIRRVNFTVGTPAITSIGFLAMMLAMAVSAVIILKKRRLGWKKLLMLLLLTAIFPLAANLIRLIQQEIGQHVLMVFGMCLIPVTAISLAEYAIDSLDIKTNISSLCVWLAVMGGIVMSCGYAVDANELYFKAELTEKEAVSFSNRMLASVQQTEGYRKGMDIVLIGGGNAQITAVPELNDRNTTGSLNVSEIVQSYSYDSFLRVYCAWEDTVLLYSEYHENMAEVQEMPIYPNAGSIRVIEDSVVIKLG